MNNEQTHRIAMSRGGNMGHVETGTLADYDRLTATPDLCTMIKKIRNGEVALKKNLPFRAAHYWRFRNNHRSKDDADPEAFLYQTTVDVDDKEYVAQAVTRALSLDKSAGRWQGMLLHLEHSARRKLHIDIRLPLGYTIEEAQREYSRLLGIPYDSSCTSAERIIYITTDKDEIYRSPGWYAVLPDDELERRREAYRQRGLTIDGRGAAKPAPAPSGVREVTPSAKASERNLKIFDLAMKEKGISIGQLNTNGERHNGLCAVLSLGICRLMSQEEMMAVVGQRMPEFASEPDCKQLISDFYNNYTEMNRPMSLRLSSIFTQSLERNEKTPAAEISLAAASLNEKYSARLSAIKLPPGLRESLLPVDENVKMCVLSAILPLAGALADGVRVRYCDNSTHRLGLMSVIVGQQASGKSICKKIADHWAAPLREKDRTERAKEDAWREARKRRKANEKAPEDPHALIRYVPMTISCSTLLKRLKNSQGHCLYSFSEELDTLRKTNGAGTWSSKYDIYRLGFDNGLWGQDYNSDQAESGIVQVAYNFTALGTYGALRKCFRGENVENGLSSRVIISEMPDNSFAPMPVYKQLSASQEQAIEDAAKLLMQTSGELDLPRLRHAIAGWEEQKRIEAAKSLDYAKDTYRKRAGVIAFRAGVIAHLLSRKQAETKSTIDFALLMADYVLDEQMAFFAESFCEAKKESDIRPRYNTENNKMFGMLPGKFTFDDIVYFKGSNFSRGSMSCIIARWKKAGLIKKVANNTWEKIIK